MTDNIKRMNLPISGFAGFLSDDEFAGHDGPKLKFNFTVSFDFREELVDLDTWAGNDDPFKIGFGVKQITRPNPNVSYEDVNYYNFITKVATKVDFGVITITLYDDKRNRAHNIFSNYFSALSPITNFNNADFAYRSGQRGAANIGALNNQSRDGLIRKIRVNHFYYTYGGDRVLSYDFLNPKIQNVALDELDMTQSDVNTLTFSFIYDSFNIIRDENEIIQEDLDSSIIPDFTTVNPENIA